MRQSVRRLLIINALMTAIIACEKAPEEILVTSVSISQPEAEMIEGESIQLTASVMPSNATDKSIVWASSKQSVATVSDNGRVTAVAEGTSNVTATAAGGKTATCRITVSKKFIEVTSIAIAPSSLELVEGDEATLTATVKPDNATDKTVTWSSSATDVAQVDNGKVTALKEGETTITAQSGNKTASCKVLVSKKTVQVESIELRPSSLALVEGESEWLTATVLPENATDKTVTWSSSNAGVAIIEGGQVTAKKEGEATITARAGEKEASCKVIVTKRIIPVTSVTLSKNEATLNKGEEITLTATVSPSDATDKTVSWSSSDTSVATVDQSGTIKAQKSGQSTITASAGDKKATCEITVITPVENVTLDRTSVSLEVGQSTTLVATISPNDADNKTVAWSTSDDSVASVNNGTIQALSEGTATITATVDGKAASCVVTVQKKVIPVSSITLDKKSLALNKGESATLTATVYPADATVNSVSWSSSDVTVVSVDQNGKVTAVNGGSATITARAGEQSATCVVTVSVPVTSISLNKSSLDLNKGESETLIATVSPSDATENTVTWATSNKRIATVDQNGLVTAVEGGTATISATCGGYKAECVVTVTVPVASITLSKQNLSLKKGDSANLTATVSPSNATDKTVTWSSSDESVASVSSGKVTANKSGTATITASAGSLSATCAVSVTTPVQSITLNMNSTTLEEGQGITLTATILPDDADNKSVTWTSSNASVATVDADGNVSAVKSGMAKISASADGVAATCEVTVLAKVIPVSSVTLDHTSLNLTKGQSETLTATVNPSDATDKAVTWTSSDSFVASVDQNGKVTAANGGNATITATAGGQFATCSITVTVPVASVTLDKPSITLTEGESTSLQATVNPSDATDKTVTWSSSNANIATVDQNGKVTAVNGGTATITAKAGDKEATCNVTVTVPVQSIVLNITSKTIKAYESLQLEATISPGDATNQTISWTSSDGSVASVTSNGLVQGLKEGEATITAEVDGKSAECKITVIQTSTGGNEGIGYDD